MANLLIEFKKPEKGLLSPEAVSSPFLFSFSTTEDVGAGVGVAAGVVNGAEVDAVDPADFAVKQSVVGITFDQVQSSSSQIHIRVACMELSDRHLFSHVVPFSYVELEHCHPSGTAAHSCC